MLMLKNKKNIIPYREKFLTQRMETFTEKEFKYSSKIEGSQTAFLLGGSLGLVFTFSSFYINYGIVGEIAPVLDLLYLFADESINCNCRLMLNTKPGSRLHINEDSGSLTLASKNGTRTSLAKLKTSDSVLPATPLSSFLRVFKSSDFLFRILLREILRPLEGALFSAHAPCVYENFSGHCRGGFFLTVFPGYSVDDSSGVFVGSVGDPCGLLQDPSEKRRAHFGDMSVVKTFARLGNSGAKSCVGGELSGVVEACDVAGFDDDRGRCDRAYARNTRKKFKSSAQPRNSKNSLDNRTLNISKMPLKINYHVKPQPCREPVDFGEFRILRENPLLRPVAGQILRPGKIAFERNPAKASSGCSEIFSHGMPEPDKLAQTVNGIFRHISCRQNPLASEPGKQMSVVPVILGLPPAVRLDARRIGKKHFPDKRTHKLPEPLIKPDTFNSYLTAEAV